MESIASWQRQASVADAHPALDKLADGATPIDRASRVEEYRREGWTRFDDTADPYVRV